MSEVQVLKPLKTWSHLAGRRRKPERIRNRIREFAL